MKQRIVEIVLRVLWVLAQGVILLLVFYFALVCAQSYRMSRQLDRMAREEAQTTEAVR